MLCMALATRNGRTFSRLGFVQSLELLFAQQFSRPGKRLENGDEVWTNGKKHWRFFFFQSYNKCFRSEFLFFIVVKSYSISPVCLQRTLKKALFLPF